MDALEHTPDAVAQPVQLSVAECHRASGSYEGFCTNCREITNSGVEPDARRYECESCGGRTVYGIEEALLMGAIEIAADGEEVVSDGHRLETP